jgi:hypothetical protein
MTRLRIARPQPVIQRKVGFEFETGVKVQTTPSKIRLPYGPQIFESTDTSWQIKSDNSKIEFVTKPFDETNAGADALNATMAQLTGWAHQIDPVTHAAAPGQARVAQVQPAAGTTRQYEGEELEIDGPPLNDDDIVAAPQATGGVTLDRVNQLAESLVNVKLPHLKASRTFKPEHDPPVDPGPYQGDPLDEDAAERAELAQIAFEDDQFMYNTVTSPAVQEFAGSGLDATDISYSLGAGSLFTTRGLLTVRANVETAMKAIDSADEEDSVEFQKDIGVPAQEFRAASGKLQGLLTLVGGYLVGGSLSNNPIPYTKVIAVLMSRTNFHALYNLLSEPEKRLFTPDFVLDEIANLKDGPLFTGGFVQGDQVIKDSPTRSEWIDSIINGTPVPLVGGTVPYDRLSQGSNTPEALNSSSLGAFAAPDPNPDTGANELAVLELRTLPKGQHIDDWTQTALTIFNMFRHDINRH